MLKLERLQEESISQMKQEEKSFRQIKIKLK